MGHDCGHDVSPACSPVVAVVYAYSKSEEDSAHHDTHRGAGDERRVGCEIAFDHTDEHRQHCRAEDRTQDEAPAQIFISADKEYDICSVHDDCHREQSAGGVIYKCAETSHSSDDYVMREDEHSEAYGIDGDSGDDGCPVADAVSERGAAEYGRNLYETHGWKVVVVRRRVRQDSVDDECRSKFT